MRAILCWLLLVSTALAAAPLTCRVPERKLPLRKGGTVLLDAELTNHTSSLIEGRLEVAVLRAGRRTSTHVSTELVVTPGSLTTHLLLPPPLDPAYGEGFAVQLSFVGKESSIALGDHALGNFPEGGESFVLAIARTNRRLSDTDRMRERSLRLETLRPALETSAWFATASLSVPVENLPTQPAGWCAYDVVSLDAQAFSEMKTRQLEAMACWIEAGGSAVIFADGVIGERQLAFLRRVGGANFVIGTDAEQRLTLQSNEMLPAQLGRLLLAPSAPTGQRALDSPAWRAAIGWLWKVHPDLIAEIEEHGVWPVQRSRKEMGAIESSLEAWARRAALGTQGDVLSAPRSLPIGWVVLLLGSLLILTGPADWFLLGWLRRRRWTWAVFPATCIAFAWLASHLASQYLGPTMRSSSVRVTDLAEDDRVLRDVVIRLRIPSRDEEWATETADGLCMAMPPLKEDEHGRIGPFGELAETRTEWLSPTRLRLRQNLRQWTTNWQQAVSFSAAPPAGPNWKTLIERWVRASTIGEENLEAPDSEFTIYYVPRDLDHPRSVTHPALPIDSPIDSSIAAQLCHDNALLSDVLEARSPALVAGTMLGARPRGPLAILAWRRASEGIHVLRRHVSARELRPGL